METMYITLDEAKVILRNSQRKAASGGQGQTYCTVFPRRQTVSVQGKVLDFEAYRKALERTQAVPAEEASVPESAPARHWSLGLALELALSAAILTTVATVAVGFFLG